MFTFIRFALMGGIFLSVYWMDIPSWAQAMDKTIHLSFAASEDSYLQGVPVEFTLTLRNGTEEAVRISFPSSKQFDLMIKKDETPLWIWSEGRMFAMSLTQLRLSPGERKHFDIVWAQLDRNGKQVQPGFYTAVGWLESKEKLVSKPITFEIRR